MIRRQLLRLTGADLGRIVAELIHTNSGTPAEDLVERVSGQLSRLNVASTYWPGTTRSDRRSRRSLPTAVIPVPDCG